MSNALKFTFRGFIVISAKIRQTNYCKFLQCRVKDTGIGIKEDDQQKLFKCYGKLESSAQINTSGLSFFTFIQFYAGTGLGLYLCKKLSNLLGGDVFVKSVYGKGTVFTFNIHLTDDPEISSRENLPIPVLEESSLPMLKSIIVWKSSHS